MNNLHLNVINDYLLYPFSLTIDSILSQINLFKLKKIDFGDLYLQKVITESWNLEDNKVKHGSFSIDQGVSARSVFKENVGFSYSNNISIQTIQKLIKTSLYLLEDNKHNYNKIVGFNNYSYNDVYDFHFLSDEITTSEKINFLHQVNNYAKNIDSRIIRVNASLSRSFDIVILFNTDGLYAMDVRPLVRMNITLLMEHKNIREQFSSGGGGRYDYSYFLKDDIWQHYVNEAYECACKNLFAKHAPSGSMSVILGSGWPAILLHEAVGHGLEGDFNRKLISHYSNKIGCKVASDKCTIIDEGCIKNRRGSLLFDDEGTPTQKTILIDQGTLVNYLHDKISANFFNVTPTGNARRESYAYPPLPRMTNTYMLPGSDSIESMISSIDHGIYALHFNGGQVDITSGQFVFVADHSYLIKNGKISHPIKGVSLIGNGSDVMKNISMVGDDFSFDPGIGTCGKEGQCIPVGVGQPTLKIDSITVGGS